jgi:hypothetical protein
MTTSKLAGLLAPLALNLCLQLAHAETINITCQLTVQPGYTSLVYRFSIADGDTFARETSMSKNGVLITNRSATLPRWDAVTRGNVETLWSTIDKGWSLTFFLRPNPYAGMASLFTPTRQLAASGECARDRPDASPSPPLYSSPPPSPETRPASDDVPLVVANNEAMIMVIIGGRSLPMTIDTGATLGQVLEKFADQLIADGEATEGAPERFRLANGKVEIHRTVIVNSVVIGSHTLHNVRFAVGNSCLLGFNALSAIGTFKIDPVRGVLSFN